MEETLPTEEITAETLLPEADTTIWDNISRGRIAYIIIWVIMGVLLLAIVSDYFELQLLKSMANGDLVSGSEADANDFRQRVIGLTQVALLIVSAFTFISWFRRAYGNLNRIGIRTENDENMALWYFFIPIVCFFKPPQIMHEIWDKTQIKIKDIDSNYSIKSSNYLISIWWLFYIVSNFIGRYLMSVAFKEKKSIEEFISYSQANMVADSIQILEGLALLYVIYHIRKMEVKLAEEIRRNGGTVLIKR